MVKFVMFQFNLIIAYSSQNQAVSLDDNFKPISRTIFEGEMLDSLTHAKNQIFYKSMDLS